MSTSFLITLIIICKPCTFILFYTFSRFYFFVFYTFSRFLFIIFYTFSMFNAFLYYAYADVINMKENKKEAI